MVTDDLLPNHLPSLREVVILECNQLELKKASDLHWNTSTEVLHIGEGGEGLLSALENNACCQPSVEECDSLQSLPRMIVGGYCFRRLCLKNLQSLISFPADSLPTSLRSLEIDNCEKLEFLSHETWHKYTSLEVLKIWKSCHSLTSFPLGCFPALKHLSINCCPNLESITQGEGSALNLVYLEVFICEKLKSLPEHIDLNALQVLILYRLPELASFPLSCLPSNLRLLHADCDILSFMAKPELGFQFRSLTSLSTLYFYGYGDGHVVNNLLKQQLLPASLVSLYLRYIVGIKLLEGKGLQRLTSVQELYIFKCPSLESLPEDQLPSSLVVLRIIQRPLLEARYQSQIGEHWPKIAHIPAIEIDGELIMI